MPWYMWVIYTTLVIGALSSTVNMFLQYYDIIWCRWNDCGNKNSKPPEYKLEPRDYAYKE